MADVKRIALNTIGAPKKDKKIKSAPKTIRFTLTLGESNEKTCPEFNYKELLAGEERRALKKAACRDGLHQNGNVSLMDIDEEDVDGVRALARKFEEKYGGGTSEQGGSKPGKRKKKRNEYVDLGAGYDDNDSFIDNTDAYDEIVPEEMTTAQGGFYINCGALEYKQFEMSEAQSDGEETVRMSKKAKRAVISSDDSSSDEDDEDVDDEEEDSQDEVHLDEPNSQPKLPSVQTESQMLQPKLQAKPQPPPVPPPQTVQPAVLPQKPTETKKLKRPAEAIATNSGPSKKKSTTVKDLLKEKRDYNDPKELVPNTHVSAQQKVSSSSTSIADSIESVINASWMMEDSKILPSPAKVAAPEVSVTIKTEHVPMAVPSVTASPILSARLPDNLPEDIKALALSLRAVAKQAGGNPAKFFGSNVAKSLVRLDAKTQNLSCRKEVFAYVADKVVCSAECLIKKARKFTQGRERAKAKEPLIKLKAAIDKLTPAVIEDYTKSCKNFNEDRFANGGKGEWGKISPPVQTFPWTEELRTLLREAVGPAARTGDEKSVLTFLENQVEPLWPSGWMTLPVLQEALQQVPRPKGQSPSIKIPVATTPPPQRSTSVITLAESPRLPECTTLTTTTPTKPSQQPHAPISLKQRILQDAVGGAFEPAALAKQEEEIGLLWQAKCEQPSPPPMSRPGSSDSAKHSRNHSPSPSSKDKILVSGESSKSNKSSKDRSEKKASVKSQMVKSESVKEKEASKTSASKSTSNAKRKKANPIVIPECPPEIHVPPPLTQEEIEAKALEDKNKMFEETAAATDFLSQIIHQSLSGFPNASNFSSNVTENRNNSPPPKVEMSSRHIDDAPREDESVSPGEVIVDERRERELSTGESSSSSARASIKTPENKLQQEPPALDPEISVQLEMKRVMQELMELNGQMNCVPEQPKISSVVDRIKERSDHVSPIRPIPSPDIPILSPNVSIKPMDRPRSRVDKARNLSGSTHFNSSRVSNNDLVITPTLPSNYNSNSTAQPHQSHALIEKSGRNSGVSVIAVNSGASRSNQHNMVANPMLGFQEEFQRHLMQEPEVVYVSSSPPSARDGENVTKLEHVTAFRPSHSQAISTMGHSHIPYVHGQQLSQQHQLPSVSNQDLRNSLYNYSQMQGSIQQQVLNHRVRHYPDLQQQPK